MNYLEANGLRFAYLSQGSGPLVLMVHGFPDTAHTFSALLPAVAAAGFRAVAPFTRGYAPTAVPADDRYDSDTLGADLIAMIEALGEEQAIVLGHDWGASAAYSAAGLAPERLRALMVMAIPHPASMRPSPRLMWSLRHFFALATPGGAERLRREDFAYLDELVRRWSPTWEVPPGETDAVKRCFADRRSLEAAVSYYRDLGLRPPPSQRHRVPVPTVAFAGRDDMVAPAAYERARSWFTAAYEVVEVPGGHFMHREHPEAFRDALLAALRRHS
jgi:pimeloyl-ACP methyl ester carboxylesterase